jgi:hypothetical protein
MKSASRIAVWLIVDWRHDQFYPQGDMKGIADTLNRHTQTSKLYGHHPLVSEHVAFFLALLNHVGPPWCVFHMYIVVPNMKMLIESGWWDLKYIYLCYAMPNFAIMNSRLKCTKFGKSKSWVDHIETNLHGRFFDRGKVPMNLSSSRKE